VRVVVDPGVFVSALLSNRGAPDALTRVWADGGFEVVVSPNLLAELSRVLERPHIARTVPVARVRTLVRALEAGAIALEDPNDPPAVTRDPEDDYLVALARAASAHFIVSGDRDLLEADVRPPVLTPRELLRLLQPS
jgi:putative PIN family toxin of toxin-antitoxin system